MPSSAISSVNTVVRVSTATAAAKTITAITAANPPVCTSAAHGLTNGTIVVIDGVVGMTELNGRAFMVANVAANTFELKGIDATSYTAYASGGSATPQTMTAIANVKSGQLFEGQTQQIDVTNCSSRRKEYLLDVPDQGGGSLTIDFDPTDPGQLALRAAFSAQTLKAFTATLRNGKVAAFMAYVSSFPTSWGVGQALGGTVNLTITGEESYFA